MEHTDISYMTEATALWLFGIIIVILGGWCLGLSGAVFIVRLEQVKMRVAIDLFLETLGQKLAKALHADDDHLELDALLDKLIDSNYIMTEQEWFELKNRCNHILEDKMISKGERSMAGVLAAICEQTLIVKFKKTKDTV